jgi:hypothetical protein
MELRNLVHLGRVRSATRAAKELIELVYICHHSSLLPCGSGDGSGSGYGYGSGDGDGYGYGDGYGSGYGYGYGSGDGSGYGDGYGNGDGDGDGYGSGDEPNWSHVLGPEIEELQSDEHEHTPTI